MDRPTRRVDVVARQLAGIPQPTSGEEKKGRFTVVDNRTGKTYYIEAPDGRFSLDIADEKEKAHQKTYIPGARNHLVDYRVEFIGAPFAEGQNLRGCELAPNALREAGLSLMVEHMGWEYIDKGDLELQNDLIVAAGLTESGISPVWQNRMKEKYRQWVRSGTSQTYTKWSGETIREEEDVHVSASVKGDPYDNVTNAEIIGAACGLVYERVLAAATKGNFALTVGGDHSIASGTIGALVEAYPNLAVIWVDAHADANTPETSPSLHYHGMPAAHVLGWFKKPLPGFEWLRKHLPESRLAYIGLRDIDPDEGRMLQESGAHVYTMHDVDRHGIAQVMSMALSRVDPHKNRPMHLTLDIDGMDPAAAPGTGTLARGGLSYRETHFICEEMASTNRLVGCDIVEVNPLVDQLPETMHGDDPDMGPASCTVQLACELALSALGKTILQMPRGH